MTDSPDVLRAETERTRVELGRDVDALADKVTPSKIMDRQTTRVRRAFASMRDTVMGAAHDTEQSASAMASAAAVTWLAGLERAAADRRTGQVLKAGADLGRLLASIAACESTHADLLVRENV